MQAEAVAVLNNGNIVVVVPTGLLLLDAQSHAILNNFHGGPFMSVGGLMASGAMAYELFSGEIINLDLARLALLAQRRLSYRDSVQAHQGGVGPHRERGHHPVAEPLADVQPRNLHLHRLPFLRNHRFSAVLL